MKFIADVHLGKLAKLLRMLGFDTLYNNSFTNTQIISIALNENRVLLSRNNSITNLPQLQSLTITDEDADKQIQQVLHHFKLNNQIHPFTKCIVCNGALQPVAKEKIFNKLPQKTALYFNEFWQCNNCNGIYWKGSHYEHINKMIERIKE